jgi:putative transposase
MAELGRKTKRYPSDLTDEAWARIEPLLPSRRGAVKNRWLICARC